MARNPIACAAVSLALAAAIGLLPAASAQAASAACADIEARLASTPPEMRHGRAGRYDRAAEIQHNELKRADEERRRLGCGFSVSGDAIERCASLARQSEEMQANLVDLRRKADAGPASPSSERAHLLRRAAAYGCGTGTAGPGTEELRAGGATTLRIIRPDSNDDFAPAGPAAGDPNHIVLEPQLAGVDPNGSYRTLCVRRCDGYYFPISYAVRPAHFAADRDACERRCPGTEVSLYFHRVPGEDAERMVSVLDGTPYTALPNAFLYRTAARKAAGSCICGPTASGFSGPDERQERSFRVLSPDAGGAVPTVEGSIVTIPAPAKTGLPANPAVPAPAPAAEPAGPPAGMTEKPVEDEAPDRREPAVREPVRVVGPKFLPDPSKAEVLRVPGRTPDR